MRWIHLRQRDPTGEQAGAVADVEHPTCSGPFGSDYGKTPSAVLPQESPRDLKRSPDLGAQCRDDDLAANTLNPALRGRSRNLNSIPYLDDGCS